MISRFAAACVGKGGLAGRQQGCRADLQLLLSHEGEADEGQQLLHLIKVPVRLLSPSHARGKETALRACLQSSTFILS